MRSKQKRAEVTRSNISGVVALILGCPTPFLLRPSGIGTGGKMLYRVIGWAYVHGIMFGEAMSKEGESRTAIGSPIEVVCLV